jgi:hypothetical protein
VNAGRVGHCHPGKEDFTPTRKRGGCPKSTGLVSSERYSRVSERMTESTRQWDERQKAKGKPTVSLFCDRKRREFGREDDALRLLGCGAERGGGGGGGGGGGRGGGTEGRERV